MNWLQSVARCGLRLFGVWAFLLLAVVLGDAAVARDSEEPSPMELRDLALRVDAALEAVGDSPGREYANRLNLDLYAVWLEFFRGKAERPGEHTLLQMVNEITTIVGFVEQGPGWPAPGLFDVPYAESAPRIDGRLDDEVWERSAVWTETYAFNQTEPTDEVKTTWRALWDENCLYFAFECQDVDVVAAERMRDGQVFFDDCVKMFLLPNFRFRTYWELAIGANGDVFDSIQCKQIDSWGCVSDLSADVSGLRHAQVVDGTLNDSSDEDQGYVVEVAVPFDQLSGFVRCPPVSGDRLHFMLVRLDRSNDKFKPYAFRPLQAWGHNIWNHAVMRLTKRESP